MRRTTRLLNLGIGTTFAAPALLATLAGCGLANGPITVVGANPQSGRAPVAISGTQDATHAVSAQSTTTTRLTRTSGAPGSTAAAATAGTGASGTGGASGQGAVVGTPGSGAAGVPGSGSGAAGSSTQTAVAAPAQASCTVADLRLQVSLTTSAATTSNQQTRRQQMALVLTNVSNQSCALRGYPNVDFLRAGAGGPLSEPDTFSDVFITGRTSGLSGATGSTSSTGTSDARAVGRVELPPGGAAIAAATFVTNGPRNSQGLHCDDVVAVRVFPPGSTVAISSGLRDAHGRFLRHFYVCGHGVVIGALRR